MNEFELRFNEDTHSYIVTNVDANDYPYNEFIDGFGVKPFGVSHILKMVFGNDYVNVPPANLAYACYKGSGLHSYIENRVDGNVLGFDDDVKSLIPFFNDLEFNDLPLPYKKNIKPNYLDYLTDMSEFIKSIDCWYNDVKPVEIMKEQAYVTDIKMNGISILIAGTFDAILKLDDVEVIVDYKTNALQSFRKAVLKYITQIHLYSLLIYRNTNNYIEHGELILFYNKKLKRGLVNVYGRLQFNINVELVKTILSIFTKQLLKIDTRDDENKMIDLLSTFDVNLKSKEVD